MVASLVISPGKKTPDKLASQSPCHVLEASFTHFSLTLVRWRPYPWRVWSWPGPLPLTSPDCVSLIGRTGNISQDSLWSPQPCFNGTSLQTFELMVHSCSEKFLAISRWCFLSLQRRLELSVQKSEQESKEIVLEIKEWTRKKRSSDSESHDTI